MIEIVAVQPTTRELRTALAVWPGVKWWSNAGVIWLGLVALTTIGLSARFDGPVMYGIIGLQAVMIYGLIPIGYVVQKRLARVGKSAPLTNLGSNWRLDEQGFCITNALSEQSLRWEAVVRVVEQKDRLIFAVTPARNHVLPLRCFGPGQQEAFRTLLADVTASGRLGRGVD